MQADDQRVPVPDVAAEPFDLVGIDVRRRHLDGGGQVQDHLALGGRLPDGGDRVTDLDGEIELRARKTLRAVLEDPVRFRREQRMTAHGFGALDGDVDDAGAVEPEDDPALRRRRRVVQVQDRAPDALQALEGAADQVLAGLRQHLYRHVVRNALLLDQLTDKVEVGLRGRRKTDLDLLEAEFDQCVEHAPLASGIHRFDECLVAVAQVDTAPGGRAGDGPRRPLTVGQLDGREGTVLGGRIAQHGTTLARERLQETAGIPTLGFFGLFRSCRRRPVARGVVRLGAQKEQAERRPRRPEAGG